MTTNGDPVAIGYSSGYNSRGYNSNTTLQETVEKLSAQVEQLIKLVTTKNVEEIESPIAKKIKRLLESKKAELDKFGEVKFSNMFWSQQEIFDMIKEFNKQGYTCVTSGFATIIVTL